MANLRKRIEALHEMFISEKLYIDDMILWESEFRKCILNFSFLSPKVKYEICDTVFINMHEIRLKHEEIFNEMKKRNLEVRKEMDPYFYVQDENAFCIDKSKYDDPSILKLEYATIFYKYMEFINFYERYFSRLPKAEYELERVCHYSPEFKQGLHNFLAQNKIEYLGVRNFLYRPSTKLSRLPLLLKAIFKNEGNDEFKAQYELLIDKLKQVTLKVDNLFKFYSGQFKIYRLSQSLQYVDGLQNPLALGLFQKKRALLKEGEFLIKSEIWASPIISKIYFFDHCILFCESSKGQFSTQKILLDPLFLERLLFFDINVGFNKLEGDEDKYFPLFLLETSENNLITILFEDFDVRKIYISILSDALLSIKKNYCTNLKLTKININLQNILSACQTSKFIFAEMSESMSDLESTSEQNENETDVDVITNEKLFKLKEFRCAVKEYTKKIEKHFLSSEPLFKSFTTFRSQNKILEEGSDDSDEGAIEQTSWIKKLCYGQETFSHVLNENLEDHTDDFEYIKNQEDMLIASTKNGIFKILGNDKKMIYQGITKKVLYDSQYEILMFQSGSTLCICNFNNTMNSIKPFSIKKNIGDFFYGTNTRGSFIATRNYGSSKSSLIYLFQVAKEDKKVKLDLSRKLYVGFRVYNIIFCPTKIVIACKDFEIVDMETLKTEDFLELYNPCVPMLLSMIPSSKARSVFTVDYDTFIVCFDSIGFYVDKLGRVKNTNIIFLWKSMPVDFKIYYKKLIVISKSWVDVYDITTGCVIFSEQVNGLKFVLGTHEVVLHNEKEFYKLEI